MRLYLSNIKDVKPEHIYLIDEQRAEKARRYKMPDDQKRCVAGGILLRKFLGNAVITENEFGKPIADGVCFNLSHSGDWVLLAVDDCEIGCDIERVRFVQAEKTGKYVFCENELDMITSASDKTGAFYMLWTKKEALLKCIGKGFHMPAKSVDVSGSGFHANGKHYFMKTFRFSDYIISVCSERNNIADSIEFVEI